MKILMTADTVGGVWTYALELTRALGAHDVEVALATMGAPLTPQQRDEVRQIRNLHVYESRFKLEWMDEPWDDVHRAGGWLMSLEDEIRPDIVHLNGYAHGSLLWRAPVLMVGHSCVLSWWRAVKRTDAPASWDRYREEVTRGLRSADMLVAPSHTMMSALQEHYGNSRNPRVIYNGRTPGDFYVDAKEPIILTAGRIWDEAKNIAALDRAAPRVTWPIYVAGDGQHPNGAQLENLNLRALGRLSQEVLAPWFARAAIYALPARYEPFGLSVLEAAMSGCALVLGDILSLREIWRDAAVYVPTDDPDALEFELNTLIEKPLRRNELALRASLRAKYFSSQRMATQYYAAYRELAADAAAIHTPVVAPTLAAMDPNYLI